jgi:predicted nucleic acid-binding OB-fold protein
MAIDPKQKLKDLIDELSKKDAQELLDHLSAKDEDFSSFEDIQDQYEEIKDRFKAAFQELA